MSQEQVRHDEHNETSQGEDQGQDPRGVRALEAIDRKGPAASGEKSNVEGDSDRREAKLWAIRVQSYNRFQPLRACSQAEIARLATSRPSSC